AMAEPLRYGTTSPGAILGGGLPEYNIYRTSDGWVAVAALEPHFKKRLEEALAVRNREEYQAAFLGKTSAEWVTLAQEQDIPIVTVETS
ncbi:MAG TPA: CoA transferase, partial [Geobacteraceae bacterium]